MVLNKWIIYLLVCIGSICYGQNTAKKIPLTEVIISLEKQFNVKFSYAVEDVAKIQIEKPNATFTLNCFSREIITSVKGVFFAVFCP